MGPPCAHVVFSSRLGILQGAQTPRGAPRLGETAEVCYTSGGRSSATSAPRADRLHTNLPLAGLGGGRRRRRGAGLWARSLKLVSGTGKVKWGELVLLGKNRQEAPPGNRPHYPNV